MTSLRISAIALAGALLLALTTTLPSLAHATIPTVPSDDACPTVIMTKAEATLKIVEDQATRSEAKAELAEIEAIEAEIKRLIKINGGIDRLRSSEELSRLRQLKDLLVKSEIPAAIEIYRQVFRDVEVSYYDIQFTKKKIAQYRQQIADGTVDRAATADVIAKLKAEQANAFMKFGTGYGEYLSVRRVLEGVIQNGAITDTNEMTVNSQTGAENVKRSQSSLAAGKVLRNLGAHSIATLYLQLEIPKRRPTVNQLQTLFRTSPPALLAKLRADSQREKTSVLIQVSYTLANALSKAAYLAPIPKQFVSSASEIAGVSYDVMAQNTYIPVVEKVLEVSEDPRVRLDHLMSVSNKNNPDQLLVTFARVVESAETWVEVRDLAIEVGKKIPQYKWFANRMLKAEKTASSMRPLSLFYTRSLSDRTGVIVVGAVPAGVWIYVKLSPQIGPFIESLGHNLQTIIQAH